MFDYIWPIGLVVLSNTVYQICSKSTPQDLNPFAALTVTYLVGAAASAALYYALNRGGNLMREYAHLNWASFVLGFVVVGLEVGSIFAYRAGWQVSTAATVQGAALAISLLIVGALLFKEPITATKVIGVLICLVGLYFINK